MRSRPERYKILLGRILLSKPPHPFRPERTQWCVYEPFCEEGHGAHASLTKYSGSLKLPIDKMPVYALCGVALITGAAAGQSRTLNKYH